MTLTQEGRGSTVVVLSHALALDRNMWSEVANELAADCTVIRYDHRGHGEGKPATGPFTIEDLADDVAAMIRDLSSGRVWFVGLSLGGMVAQALAARHPSLLRGVAILNSASHYPDRSIWDKRIEAVRNGGMQAVADSSIERWLTPGFRQTAAGRDVEARLRTALARMDPNAYALTCEAIANMDLRASNRSIQVPSLVVAGRQDKATPPAMSELIASEIANARLAEVDAAHVSAAEAPEEVSRLLRSWMRTL